MDFSRPKSSRHSEPALPMINVVFLLLIFFLMSAQIVTPPPFEVTPPVAQEGGRPSDDMRLFISADGALALNKVHGQAIWEALADTENPEDKVLMIRADAALPAAELAQVLTRISGLGFEGIQLATVPR